MTRAVRIVFVKELLENLRDRRVILSAFLFGVLLAPVIFGLTTSVASKRVVENQDKPLRLTVSGSEHAPNLVHFLEENGTEVKTVAMSADEAMSAVRGGGEDLVLLIDAEYGKKLQAGEPAPLDLVVDTANNQTGAGADRARRLLEAYGGQLAALRLLVRGVSPEVIRPVDVRMLDVATPSGPLVADPRHDDVLLVHVDAGRRLLSRDRYNRRGARARLARTAAGTASAARGADRRQDARDVGVHVDLAAADIGCVRRGAAVHPARSARHVGELRPARGAGDFSGDVAVRAARRRIDDGSGLVHA
jgi:hypothetical protein